MLTNCPSVRSTDYCYKHIQMPFNSMKDENIVTAQYRIELYFIENNESLQGLFRLRFKVLRTIPFKNLQRINK